jgi:hypothetical protein
MRFNIIADIITDFISVNWFKDRHRDVIQEIPEVASCIIYFTVFFSNQFK